MGVISAVVNAVGDLVGGILGTSGQQEANRTNLKIARETFENNKQMWQMENDYNTPANQMARYREAGLNPHMMYGSISSGNASAPPQMDAVRMENAYQSLGDGISGGFNSFIDTLYRQKELDANIELKRANSNKLNAEAEATRGYRAVQSNAYTTLLGEQTLAERARTQYNLVRTAREKFGYEMEQALRDITIAIENQKLRNMSVQEQDMYSQMVARDVENMLKRSNISKIEFEKNLKSLYYQLDSRKQSFEESKEARRVYEWSQEHILNKNRYKFDRWYKQNDIDIRGQKSDVEIRKANRDYWLPWK